MRWETELRRTSNSERNRCSEKCGTKSMLTKCEKIRGTFVFRFSRPRLCKIDVDMEFFKHSFRINSKILPGSLWQMRYFSFIWYYENAWVMWSVYNSEVDSFNQEAWILPSPSSVCSRWFQLQRKWRRWGNRQMSLGEFLCIELDWVWLIWVLALTRRYSSPIFLCMNRFSPVAWIAPNIARIPRTSQSGWNSDIFAQCLDSILTLLSQLSWRYTTRAEMKSTVTIIINHEESSNQQ